MLLSSTLHLSGGSGFHQAFRVAATQQSTDDNKWIYYGLRFRRSLFLDLGVAVVS
jgi:hypothetical protein